MDVDAEPNPHVSENDEQVVKAPKRPRSASTSEDSRPQPVRPRIYRSPPPISVTSLEEQAIDHNSTASDNPASHPENDQVTGQGSALSDAGAPVSSANHVNGSATPTKGKHVDYLKAVHLHFFCSIWCRDGGYCSATRVSNQGNYHHHLPHG
jgi:hypothetical protein